MFLSPGWGKKRQGDFSHKLHKQDEESPEHDDGQKRIEGS
jgi:hypothetical protein